MQHRAAVAVPLAVNQVRGPPNSATWQPLTQVKHLASSRRWSASAEGKAAVALWPASLLGATSHHERVRPEVSVGTNSHPVNGLSDSAWFKRVSGPYSTTCNQDGVAPIDATSGRDSQVRGVRSGLSLRPSGRHTIANI